jgi:hypothetical protein
MANLEVFHGGEVVRCDKRNGSEMTPLVGGVRYANWRFGNVLQTELGER